ncbi:hypothetical protein ACJ6WD_10560 [Streptomyces sp. VTCC 41912]
MTLSYDGPDGEPIEVTMTLTEVGLSEVLIAMENGAADDQGVAT